ncbi:hypothetical protein V2J09_018979 [Rumex salicifolius]
MVWIRGVFKVPASPYASNLCKVAASLRVSPLSGTLIVPSANAIFFNGDRVEGTGNTVIDSLSNLQNIADIIVSKFGETVNAWVIEASTFNGPFAVYKEFIPSLNKWGEPNAYRSDGFPASSSIVALLSSFLEKQAKDVNSKEPQQSAIPSSSCQSETFLLGFSKGGTVLNQLVTELGFSDLESPEKPDPQEHDGFYKTQIIPNSKHGLLNSVTQIHYVDVGLNSAGAYLTDYKVIRQVANHTMGRNIGIRFVLHGTPRQWCDTRRDLIRKEKDKMVKLLEIGAQESGGKLQVLERFYFGGKPPDLQMHFEVIERLDIS